MISQKLSYLLIFDYILRNSVEFVTASPSIYLQRQCPEAETKSIQDSKPSIQSVGSEKPTLSRLIPPGVGDVLLLWLLIMAAVHLLLLHHVTTTHIVSIGLHHALLLRHHLLLLSPSLGIHLLLLLLHHHRGVHHRFLNSWRSMHNRRGSCRRSVRSLLAHRTNTVRTQRRSTRNSGPRIDRSLRRGTRLHARWR